MNAEEIAEAVLVAHQRHRGGCLCGWAELGKSHPGHQVAMLRGAYDSLPVAYVWTDPVSGEQRWFRPSEISVVLAEGASEPKIKSTGVGIEVEP